jgi:hypothetical protein
LIFTWICGELWLVFVFAGVRLGLLTVFLRVRALENAVFLSQKRGQNVVIRVVDVIPSLVVFRSSFWLVLQRCERWLPCFPGSVLSMTSFSVLPPQTDKSLKFV